MSFELCPALIDLDSTSTTGAENYALVIKLRCRLRTFVM